MKVGIIDYGMGNIFSLRSALIMIRPEIEVVYSSIHEELEQCNLYFLPGVGNFKLAVEKIDELDLRSFILRQVKNHKKPIMGICLGMQLLFEIGTESGHSRGLGLLPGKVERFSSIPRVKIPHIGFNQVLPNAKSDLLSDIELTDFYFVHSFKVPLSDSLPFIASTCKYSEEFIAVAEHENICGTQFHPEKSQTNGLKLLSNFISKYT